MLEEKRKSPRYKCLLPAELIKPNGRYNIIDRATIHDFSREGLKINIYFSKIKLNSIIELRLYIPEKQVSTHLSGEIAWRKQSENRLEAGVKIKHMDEKSKHEIYDWVFPIWAERNDGGGTNPRVFL